ncbi:hypothetical protein OROHE_004708 [Orobanche hederae]
MKKGKNSGIKYKSISSFFKKAEDSSRDVVVSPNIEPSQEVRLDEPIGSPNVDPSLEVRGDETIVSPNVEPSAEARGVESEIDSIERDPALRVPIEELEANRKDEIRLAYIKLGPYQPILRDYPLTFDGQQWRPFNKIWFNEYPWIEYSPTADSMHCLPCFLSICVSNYKCPFSTVTGYANWKRCYGKDSALLKHGNSLSHMRAQASMESLGNAKTHVDKAVNPMRPMQIEINRKQVRSTIDSVRWLTMQGFGLRGHDESPSSLNRGNLIELLKFLASKNRDINDCILENAPSNAKYISPSVQKEILSILARRVRNMIREEIGDAKFCILVDEAKDVANKEQMAIVLRFVDVDGFLRERFFDVVHVGNTMSATLKDGICDVLSRYNLQLCNMRGQGYDGASNMRGSWNGLQALFLRECAYAYHVHCFAHRLQLALVGAAEKEKTIWCFISHLNSVVKLVSASPKRHYELRSAQAIDIAEMVAEGRRETGTGANQMGSLHRPGTTRWSSHFDSTCSLIDMFGAVITVLQNMVKECPNYAISGEAYGNLKVLKSFDFIFILHLMNRILGLSHMLCQSLQNKSLDILNAMKYVATTKALLGDLRNDGFDTHIRHVESVCGEFGVLVPNMGDPYRGVLDDGLITLEHHYRVDVFNGVIDCQLAELNSRFNDGTIKLLQLSGALDPKDNFMSFQADHIYNLAHDFYPSDFTHQEMYCLKIQLQHYSLDIPSHESFQNMSTIAQLCRGLTETSKARDYSLIDRLIRLVCTLPVTTATTERAFSSMKRLKTAARNKMDDEYFSNSMIVYIERQLASSVDVDSVIDEFYSIKHRRVHLM